MSQQTRDAWTKHVTLKQLRPPKYGNKKTTVDGITFDSKKEAQRYHELKLMEKAGEIHLLELQPEFVLRVRADDAPVTMIIGKWIGDFRYCQCAGGSGNCGWSAVQVEDVKGMKTPLYRWKKKHVEAQYGIKIRET